MHKIINLENYRTQLGSVKSRVFTGRDRGEEVRNKSNIDQLFAHYDKITIIIPADVNSITPSFLEELFFNIVKKYGNEKFMNKIQWNSNGNDISSQLDEAIERILQDKTGLD